MKYTSDSFQNFQAGMGQGAATLNSAATYGFAYYTKNRLLMEAMYRGSWIVNKVVNIVPDDMTRPGIELRWPSDPDAPTKIHRALNRLGIWQRLNSGLRWGRLFGGAIGVLMIDGQDVNTPLKVEAIGQNQFRGLWIMDRWMLTPSPDTVTDMGPNFGKPRSYQVVSGRGVPFAGQNVHWSRVIRFEGLELPYYQRTIEAGWGLSVIEPLYDRMIAFDTATHGTANLIHKAHLRIMKIKDLNQIIASGGDVLAGLIAKLNAIRQMQTNEGITLLSDDDAMEFADYTFTGLSDVILQFGQQLCGAADIPMTRVFGQAPAGLNATGDSDLRNYYDKIMQGNETHLREPLYLILRCLAKSELGQDLPDEADFTFLPLWQLSDTEKASIASTDVATILAVDEAGGLVSKQHVLRELQNSSRVTGRFSSISDEDVQAADDEVPDPLEEMAEQAEVMGGAAAAGKEAKADPTSSQVGS